MEKKTGTDLETAIAKQLEDKLPGIVSGAIEKALGDGKSRSVGQFRGAPGIVRESEENSPYARKFEVKEHQKGIGAARLVRAFAFGKGDVEKAAYFVGKMYNDDLGDEIKKSLQAGDFVGGGALIIPEYASEIIELLRARTVVRAAGARVVDLSSGTLTIRRQTAGGTASYVGESENIGVTAPTTGDLVLVAKKLAALTPISNDLIRFTSGPSADMFVRDDLVMEMSIREDLAFLRDDGTQNTPKGMRYWAAAANITATNGTTSTQIESDFRDLINGLEDNDVRLLNPAWFMHPSRKNYLRNLRDGNGNLIYPEIRGPNPTLYGYPVFTSTSIPKNLGGGTESELYFADMADMVIGESSTIEIEVSGDGSYVESGTMKSAFSRDETLIRVIARHDFVVRHAESIAVKTGVTWGG